MNGLNSGLSVRVLGVHTGGGFDQISLTLLQYQRSHRDSNLRVELVQHGTFMLSASKRLPLVTAHRDAQLTMTSITRFNILLGIIFCDGIKDFCAQHSIPFTSIDLVSAYTPAALTNTRNASNDVSIDSSFGWNKVISAGTGLSTVFNFNIIENATPRPQLSYTNFVEKLLLRHPTEFRACLHIGELATINYIPPLADDSSCGTLARPCGPGSLLVDYAVRYCSSNVRGEDHDGRTAQSGQVHQGVVDRFLSSHDYSRRQPSLTIAREMFGNHEAQHVVDECLFLNLSEADTIATITRITSHNIVTQYQRLLALFFPHGQKVDELFIAGPSARNSNIIDYLEEKLPQTLVTKPLEDVGVPGEAIEAVSLAHLALEAVLNQATRNAPTPPRTATSSATFDTVEGQVIPGHGWDRLLEEVLRFSEGTRLNVASDVVFKTKLDTPEESARSVNGLRN